MARPIHQLIAQSRGPNLMGAQASAIQQMAALQNMEGQRVEQDYAKKRMASVDQEAESARMKEGWGVVANMGLQISKLPPEQRAAAYQQARRQASLYMPAGLPPLPEEYNEQTQQALDFAVSQQFGAAEHEAWLKEQQAGFTLEAGDTRFDGQGNQIAAVPPSADGSDSPSAVREYNFFQGLNPEQQREFLRVKRAAQVIDTGGGGLADITAGAPQQVVTPESATALDANRAGAMTSAQEQAKTNEILPRAQVERTAEGQAELPQAEIEANEAIRLVDELLDHPGFGYAVGKSSVLPVIPGSDASDFIARLDQMKGKQFLQAYQSLKGGGQITEVEGKKAEDAISRMKTSQSEPEFKKAARDFQELIRNGLKRDRKKAGAEVADDDIQSLIDKYAD